MSKVYAVILAGGKGHRMGEDKPKQFLPLGDKPIIIRTLEIFCLIEEVNHIIVVSPQEYINMLQEMLGRYRLLKILEPVAGGTTRQGSAYNALTSQNFNDNDILIFHDAARPFVEPDTIRRSIKETAEYGATGVYVPAIDTITEFEGDFVKTIPPREKLYYTQTPQTFLYGVIKKAHEKALSDGKKNASDDVSLVIEAGYKVKRVEGSYSNIKITTPHDYNLASYFAERFDL